MNAKTLDYTLQLRELMLVKGISSFKQLSQQAGISEKQLMHLRQGKLQQMKVETLLKLSQTLGIEIADLLTKFEIPTHTTIQPDLAGLQQEYQRLEKRLDQQKQELLQEFQQSSLQILEPWLLQWSAAAYAAQQNPQFPAKNLVLLLRPVEQLLQDWEIEATAIVGSEIPYDPQQHQLMSGTAELGALVRVRYAGYRQRDRLLYRAKVSPIEG